MEPSCVGRKILLALTKGRLLKARLGSAVISEEMWEVFLSTFFPARMLEHNFDVLPDKQAC